MNIREDFEKAFEEEFPTGYKAEIRPSYRFALWAAKWMVERCAKAVEHSDSPNRITLSVCKDHAEQLRQLAKELGD